MSNYTSIPSRTGLNQNQIKALQRSLDAKNRGKIIDVPAGSMYRGELEVLARVGEELTRKFTGHFSKGSFRVPFLLLDSEKVNAYAYWMNSFEAICITTSLAIELDTLCDDVASYLVRLNNERSGYAYIRDLNLSDDIKRQSLKGLLLQGAMAFFIGHEVGHLSAGHKPVVAVTSANSVSSDEADVEQTLFVDDFIVEATSTEQKVGSHSLRLNAHEVDADVQGIALSAAFWLEMSQSVSKLPAEAELLRAAMFSSDRLLLLASTGTAIAMSLMGFKEFNGDWNRQASHPLTAVRCVVGLVVLAQRLAEQPREELNLQLQPACIEALSLVHSRLGSLLLRANSIKETDSLVIHALKDAPSQQKLGVMFRATGMTQVVARSNEVVQYLNELSAEFDACAPQREHAIRVSKQMLAKWTAQVLHA